METRTIQLMVPASFEALCRAWAEKKHVSPGDVVRTVLNRGLGAIIAENKQSARFQVLAAMIADELAETVEGATIVQVVLD